MQDRFKYRSYGRPNAIIEGMQNLYTFEETENGYINVKVDKGWLAFVKKEDLKIMQCTGLKDKNDKFIYEGDIIKCSYGSEFAIGVIEWDSEELQFALKIEDDFYSIRQKSKFDIIEILGNIYENPELLKE